MQMSQRQNGSDLVAANSLKGSRPSKSSFELSWRNGNDCAIDQEFSYEDDVPET
jgi:hypothetical protein